jgi:hypothetical protein
MLNFNSKNVLGVRELALYHLVVCFFVFVTPSILGDRNFLNSNLLLTIFSALDAQIGGVQVLFGHQKTMKPSPWIRPVLST